MIWAFRYLRVPVIVLWLTITLCPGEGPQQVGDSSSRSSSRSAHSAGEKRKMSGVGNFGEVTPRLFRGGQPTRQGFEALAKSGIDIVVDTRGNRSKTEGKEVRRLGMRYVAIPWHCPFPHDEVFARFLRLVR